MILFLQKLGCMKEFTLANSLMIGTQFVEETGTIRIRGFEGVAGDVLVGIKKEIKSHTVYC